MLAIRQLLQKTNIVLLFHLHSFAYVFSISISSTYLNSGSSVSGYINLDIANAAGALITEADNKCDADTPKHIYAAMMDPAIVAKPPVMTACISESVIPLKNGRINSGASV